MHFTKTLINDFIKLIACFINYSRLSSKIQIRTKIIYFYDYVIQHKTRFIKTFESGFAMTILSSMSATDNI